MTLRSALFGLLSLIAATPVIVGAQPAAADRVVIGQSTIFDTRPWGPPATAEPWRTLAFAHFENTWGTGEMTWSVTLGGEIPAGRWVRVDWVLGFGEPTNCQPGKTFTKTATATNPLLAVVETKTYSDLAHDYTCFTATLRSDGKVTDRMADGVLESVALSGAGAVGSLDNGLIKPAPVRVGKPTPVLLMVTSHLLPTSQVAVSASGSGASLRPFTTSRLEADQTIPVVASVTLREKARRSLLVHADDDRGSADYDHDYYLTPAASAGRPRPGSYRSAEGWVTFTVDRRFRVRNLRATNNKCDANVFGWRFGLGRNVTIPRSGFTAAVKKATHAYTGVQLRVATKRKLTGYFVYASRPGSTPCLNVADFVARRVGP